MLIENSELAVWAYSTEHLLEVLRGNNRDALIGIEKLKALEIFSVVDTSKSNWVITGEQRIRNYFDPYARLDELQEAHAQVDEYLTDSMHLFINALFDKTNIDTLIKSIEDTPKQIRDLLDSVGHPGARSIEYEAIDASKEFASLVDSDIRQLPKIEKQRKEMGLPVNATQLAEAFDDPLQYIWEQISPGNPGLEKDLFFGFKQPDLIRNLSDHVYSQLDSFATPALLLSFLGYNPDKGMKDARVLNAMSDSRHVGYASYCQKFLTSDYRLAKKVAAIYHHRGLDCEVMHAPYRRKGYRLSLMKGLP